MTESQSGQPGPYETQPIPEEQPEDSSEHEPEPDEGEPLPSPYTDPDVVTDDMRDNVVDNPNEGAPS